jgi:hypothetical protein
VLVDGVCDRPAANANQTRWGSGRSWIPGLWLLTAIIAISPGDSVAAPGEASGSPGAEIDARPLPSQVDAPVDLDRLLRLPEGFGSEIQRRGGATPGEWRARFETARLDIEGARRELARLEKELGSASESSSAWQISAPGADSPENSPLSFRLRQEVKDQRGEITASERRLRALDVEADLADVPADWRK